MSTVIVKITRRKRLFRDKVVHEFAAPNAEVARQQAIRWIEQDAADRSHKMAADFRPYAITITVPGDGQYVYNWNGTAWVQTATPDNTELLSQT